MATRLLSKAVPLILKYGPLAAAIPGVVMGAADIYDKYRKLQTGGARRRAGRPRGRGLSHFGNAPIHAQRARYVTGGAIRKRRGKGPVSSFIKKLPLGDALDLLGKTESAFGMGRRRVTKRRAGKGPVSDFIRKLPLSDALSLLNKTESAFGLGARRRVSRASSRGGLLRPGGRGMVKVAPHISHTKYGQPVHVHGYMRRS